MVKNKYKSLDAFTVKKGNVKMLNVSEVLFYAPILSILSFFPKTELVITFEYKHTLCSFKNGLEVEGRCRWLVPYL